MNCNVLSSNLRIETSLLAGMGTELKKQDAVKNRTIFTRGATGSRIVST